MVLLPFHPDFGPGDLSISQDTALYDPSRPSKTPRDPPRPSETPQTTQDPQIITQDPPRPSETPSLPHNGEQGSWVPGGGGRAGKPLAHPALS